jgi:ribosomal-protein-alanine N-acetyltransferase
MNIPALQTEHVTLRPLTIDDIDPLYAITNVDGMMRYFPNTAPPTRERVEKWINIQFEHWAKHNNGWWALEVENTFAGWCGLQYLPDTDEMEVGYLLAKPFWGKGYATEASRVSVEFGFRNFDYPFIVGIVHPENIGSQRVLEKSGMTDRVRTMYFGMDCYRYEIDRARFEAEYKTDGGRC